MRPVMISGSVRETMRALALHDLLSLKMKSVLALQRAADGVPGREWMGHERALAWYCLGIADELLRRECGGQAALVYETAKRHLAKKTAACDWALTGWPAWMQDPQRHLEDREMLYKKDPAYYAGLKPEEAEMDMQDMEAGDIAELVLRELRTREEALGDAVSRAVEAEAKLSKLAPPVIGIRELLEQTRLDLLDIEGYASLGNKHRAKSRGSAIRDRITQLLSELDELVPPGAVELNDELA